MSFIKKALLYTALVAAGAGLTYIATADRRDGPGRQYDVVEQCGNLYVQHKASGLMAEVDDDFDIRPLPGGPGRQGKISPEACRQSRDFSERLEDAYEALTD